MKYKKILIINEGHSDNLGDQAINDSLQYLLKCNAIENIEFQDFTKNTDKPIEIYKEGEKSNKKDSWLRMFKKLIPSKIKWLIKNITRVIKISKNKYDLVIIGGGQLILSNETFSIAMFSWVLLLKLYRNENIVLFAVGSGTKFTFIDGFLYKHLLKKVSKIYVRDEKSKMILKDTFNVDSSFVYDVAFIHKNIINKVSKDKKSILLGVISFNVYTRYNKGNLSKYNFFETWITLLKENGLNIEDVKLFYTTQEDRTASLEFQKYILDKYGVYLTLVETNTKEKLIELLSGSSVVVSARMHALILALTCNCKIFTYPISSKLIEFGKMFNKDFDKKCLLKVQNNINSRIVEVLND